MTTSTRERLSNLQIFLLRSLLKCGGYLMPITIPKWQREAAIKLWRRGLVNIWFQKNRDSCAGHGPFFSLTIFGARLAHDFLYPAPRGSSGAEKVR